MSGSFNQLFGQNGKMLDETTTTSTGDFFIIKALDDSVIEVTSNWTNAAADESVSIPAQGSIEGKFTSVTVVTGRVVCYE